MNISLHIVTSEQTLDIPNLSTVIVPSSTGELEILPGHTHLLTGLDSGFVKRKEDKEHENLDQYKNHEKKQEISGGIMHCIDNQITIITS